ncbi:MAG: Uncharacterized protein Athens101410_436 [Parcubacteria group bacterium Athens1014_10]|nr:MAG: Uncharacterized protein Athens101410_436 [Parcubacteria group bacterium Athens1014_10]TSD05515.1 MAG: Uncharacterized protein Athens071412_325 [Parcubacteria group bacterium Athens0714_12]
MTLKKYLSLISLITLVCWVCFGVIIYNLDPEITNFYGFLLFYFGFFLALLGILSLAGFIIRARFSKDLIFKQVIVCFRQAIWLSSLIIFFLVLQSLRLLRWWNITFFILFLAFLEFFFLIERRKKVKKNEDEK